MLRCFFRCGGMDDDRGEAGRRQDRRRLAVGDVSRVDFGGEFRDGCGEGKWLYVGEGWCLQSSGGGDGGDGVGVIVGSVGQSSAAQSAWLSKANCLQTLNHLRGLCSGG